MRTLRRVVTPLAAAVITTIATPVLAQLPPPDLRPGDQYRVIFVTSTTNDGDLGRVGGADEFVNLAAQRTGSLIRETSFRALVSTDSIDALDRFPGDAFPVYNTRGELVADRLSDLLDGLDTDLKAQAWFDETGDEISSRIVAWTGTAADGSATARHCDGWTTDGPNFNATIGHPDEIDERWVDAGTLDCSNLARVYGLSDPIPIKGPELFVPAAASAFGQAGTHWTTTGWFLNLTPTTVTIRGSFLQQGRNNLGIVQSPISLGTLTPLAFLEIEDIVAKLGGTGKAGAIFFTFEPLGQVQTTDMVRVTTYTSTPNQLGGGAYGQAIPAVPEGLSESVYVSGLFQNSTHRTNLGMVNTSPEQITVRIEFSDLGGQQIGVTVEWTLLPFEHRQRSLPDLGVSQIDGGGARITLQSADGSFRAYTSTVDQITGDAAYNAAQ